MGLLLHQLHAFRLQCRLFPELCALENWNPCEEGYFVLNYLPKSLHMLKMNNLIMPSIDGTFLSEASRSLRGIVVDKSSAVKSLFVSKNSTIKIIKIIETQLSKLHFERNYALQQVLIAKCTLKEIPASVHNLINLESFTIGEAFIMTVDLNYFIGLACLNTLQVEMNSVNSVIGLMLQTNSTDLTTLKLWYNQLTTFQFDLVKPFQKLHTLNIAHNVIRSVVGNLTNQSLRYFAIQHNLVSKLDFCSWNQIVSLEWLRIGHNRLRYVPSCLTTFPNVTLLDLSFNWINHVQMHMFVGLNNLKDLYLGGNKLTSFEFGTDIVLPNLVQLRLQKTCLCRFNELEAVQERMPKLNIIFIDFYGENCNDC